MRFTTIIFRNLGRRPLRSGLTLCGIAVAVGAVVALGSICNSFERALLGVYSSRNVDLVVVRAGAAERLTSALDQTLADRIRRLPGVREVAGSLIDVVAFEELDLFGVVVQGWEPGSFLFDNFELEEGRMLTPEDGSSVMLGSILAGNLEKQPGDQLEIVEGDAFQVVGIFNSHSMLENGAMVVPLAELQRLMERPQQVTAYNVVVDQTPKDRNLETLREAIESLSSGLAAMPTDDYVNSSIQIRMANWLARITALIALLIGSIGVLNTMVMTLFERTEEIGILRAIGWRPSRVLRLLLLESLVLCLAGAAAGTAGAILLIRGLVEWAQVGGLIDGRIGLYVILEGLLISVVVGLAGGAYPAVRGARLLPNEALRGE